MIEYILLAALFLILVGITQFNRLMQWSLQKQNLAGLQAAKHGSELEQSFYQTYMTRWQQGQNPRIQATTDAIEFEPPIEAVQESQLSFNLSPTAINQLRVVQDHLQFTGKFSGTAIQVTVPLAHVTWLSDQESC